MVEVGIQFLVDFTLVMVVVAISSVIFPRLNLPPIIGYLIGGILLGPAIDFLPTIRDTTSINFFADLGIILLMFSLGLEFNLKRLRKVGLFAIVAGAIEIGLMLTIGYTLGQLMGWSQIESVFLGAVMSISSTALITKSLMDTGRLSTEEGEAVVGILIIEDFFVVLFLTLASPLTSGVALDIFPIVGLVVTVLLFISLSIVLGVAVIPRLMDHIVRRYRRETILLVALGLCFGMSLLAMEIGLSVAIGAFMMGIVISQAKSADVVLSEVRPLANVFIAIFFVSIGMLIDPRLAVANIVPALLIAAVFIMAKLFSVTTASYAANLRARTSLLAGFGMVTMGEFSFIIAKTGVDTGALSPTFYSIVITAALISMLAYPLISRRAEAVIIRLAGGVPVGWVERLGEMERLREGVRKRLSASSVRAQEAKRQLMMIFLNLMIIVSIVLVTNLIYLYRDSIALLSELEPGTLGLILLAIAIPLLIMPMLTVVSRMRAIVSLFTLCVMEEGECKRREKKVVTKLFTELLTGLIGILLIFVVIPFIPGLGRVSWVAVGVVIVMAAMTAALLWDAFRSAHQRFEEALRRGFMREKEE